jgi:hypothetical protein
MAPPFKLTDEVVKNIRRRVRAGEHRTDLADEFGVDRKTIWRRLDALDHAEAQRAEQVAEKRLRRQATREKRKLVEREHHGAVPSIEVAESNGRSSQKRNRVSDVNLAWLDRPKTLSGRAFSEAAGLVRVRLPDGSSRRYVERAEVEARLDEGWLLD